MRASVVARRAVRAPGGAVKEPDCFGRKHGEEREQGKEEKQEEEEKVEGGEV